jgi:hypothetical protein
MCDCDINEFKNTCENNYCNNKMCDNCTKFCDCCDNKICKSCAALCEIEGCENYVCIPLFQEINDKYEYEYKYNYESNPCWAGCGIKYACIAHRHITDEDLVICINCSDGSEYICKCGNCLEDIIYKN